MRGFKGMRTQLIKQLGSGSSSRESRRGFLFLVVLSIGSLALLAGEGCGGRPATPIHSLEDLNNPNMIVGGETETVSLRMGQEALPKAKIANFATPADAYSALLAGRIDAIAYDRPPLDYAATQNDKYFVLPQTVGEGHIAVGAPLSKRDLMDKINEFIALYRAEHTYEEMCEKWNGALKPVDPNSKSCYEDMYKRWVNTIDPPMPDIPKPQNPTNPGKPLIVGNDPQNVPMSFVDGNDQMTGFDSEFVMRFALWYNVEFEFKRLYYDALFPAVESGQLDFAVGNLDKTPERAETMLFSDDYIECPAGIMILKSRWQPLNDASEAPADETESAPEADVVEVEATEVETTVEAPAETATDEIVEVETEAEIVETAPEASDVEEELVVETVSEPEVAPETAPEPAAEPISEPEVAPEATPEPAAEPAPEAVEAPVDADLELELEIDDAPKGE